MNPADPSRGPSLVVMGVAGCGKSSLGAELARALGRPLVEGDDFHPPANVAKMRAGTPLSDADRAGWLDALGATLRAHEPPPLGDGRLAVLTCSALKAAYRERLRAAAPGLAFVHLTLTPDEAKARVAHRGNHYFNPQLVDSQFDTLEPPAGEPRVLSLPATWTPDALAQAVQRWLADGLPETTTAPTHRADGHPEETPA